MHDFGWENTGPTPDRQTGGNAVKRYALAADVGGTKIRAGLVDIQGAISERYSTATMAELGKDASVVRVLESLERVHALAEPGSVVGVGISVAGPTDPETGVMSNPPNLPGWDGLTLVPVVGERLSLRVSVANDATLAALAEHRYGAGRGYRHLIYMTVSTGIGGGFVVNNELYSGARGVAGEIGHMIIHPDEPPCSRGGRGCLEALCSGTAVARIAQERLSSGEKSAILNMAGGRVEDVAAPIVFEAARAGDATAKDIVAGVSANLGIGLASLILAFDPEAIVIGGGMSESLDLMLPGVLRQIDRLATDYLGYRPAVVKSELGGRWRTAGSRGAGLRKIPNPEP